MFHSSLRHDPIKVVFNSGETCRVTDFTSSRSTKGNNTDLFPLLSGFCNFRLHVKRTARITIAGSFSSGCVNADDPSSNNTIDSITFRVRYNWTIFHHSEDGRDTSGTVRWLSPSSACNKLSFIGSVSSRGHAGRFDVVIKVNWRGEFDQGDVI